MTLCTASDRAVDPMGRVAVAVLPVVGLVVVAIVSPRKAMENKKPPRSCFENARALEIEGWCYFISSTGTLDNPHAYALAVIDRI